MARRLREAVQAHAEVHVPPAPPGVQPGGAPGGLAGLHPGKWVIVEQTATTCVLKKVDADPGLVLREQLARAFFTV